MQSLFNQDEAEIYRPLFSRLLSQRKIQPPFTFKLPIMPLYKLGKLCLLWKEMGFSQEAGAMAHQILKFRSFPSLWCQEKEYNKSFFLKVMHKLELIDPQEEIKNDRWDFPLKLIEKDPFSLALALDGKKTSIGALLSEVNIQAFGPQSDPSNFGIEGKRDRGWNQVAAYPDVWQEMCFEEKEDAFSFHFRFCGLSPQKKLSLAFYLQAKNCLIENKYFYPKSLNRFTGQTDLVVFGDFLKIQTERASKVELIALAGQGSFWDADFLLLYPISPISPQISLIINK